jgi:hypothetical protein
MGVCGIHETDPQRISRDLRRVDLNLIVVLITFFEGKNIAWAAQRIHLSQF